MSRKLMLTSVGSYENPADKVCWSYCTSCGRCENKGAYSKCGGCSGRYDPQGQRHPDRDDYCRCKQGILQWVTKEGRLTQVQFKSDPFAAVVKYEKIDQDEADWESYLKDTREKLDDEHWDPIKFDDGSSSQAWLDKARGGK